MDIPTHWPSETEAGMTGWVKVYDKENVWGMWQARTDGVLFFCFAVPVAGRVAAHWRHVQSFRRWP